MNPLDQRFAIAESVGWRHREGGMWYHPDSSTVPETLIPDYLNDLNAMHEVERNLDNNKYETYEDMLDILVRRTGVNRLTSATAAQRAEAYLRTIGKWKD